MKDSRLALLCATLLLGFAAVTYAVQRDYGMPTSLLLVGVALCLVATYALAKDGN